MSARLTPIAIAMAASVLMAAPAVAQPPVQVTCDFYEIEATNDKSPSIDGELKPLEKYLKRSPFKTWNNFKLMSKVSKTLTKKKPEQFNLKSGTGTAELLEIVDKTKARMNVSLA